MGGRTDKFRKNVTTAAQSIADVSPFPVFMTLPDAVHVYLNAPLQRLRGDTLDSAILPFDAIFDAESVVTLQSISKGVTGTTTAALNVLLGDGSRRESVFRIALARDDDGQLMLYGTTLNDGEALPESTVAQIESSLRRTTQVVKRDTKRLSLETQIFRFAERSSDGLMVFDEKGLCTYVNSTLERLFDFPREGMIGKEISEIVRPTNREVFQRRVADRVSAREGGVQTVEIYATGLGRREISFRWYPISESPRATGFVISDVTTIVIRRRARHALAALSAASEVKEILEGLRHSLHAENVVFVSLWPDLNHEITLECVVDGSAENACPCEERVETIRQNVRDYVAGLGGIRSTHKIQVAADESERLSMILRPVESLAGRVEGFVAVFIEACPDGWQAYEEVTADFARRLTARIEFRRAASEVVEERKRESLEQLARGIAHDFNNVFMSINGHLQLIERKLQEYPEMRLRHNVEHALRSAERGKKLVEAMVAYSDSSLPNMQPINIADVVDAVIIEASARIRACARLRLELDPNLTIFGDPAILKNTIDAVVLNALDAIEASKVPPEAESQEKVEGLLSISLALVPSVDGKIYVQLSVGDNGTGMSEETRARIFDPFFTTRSPGQGVGLGMSVVQAAVARMQGKIEINTRKDHGTIVMIAFPRAELPSDGRAIRRTDSFRSSDTQRQRAKAAKHVLVVDDAPEQRELIVECLRDAGYSTEDVGDGELALKIIRRRPRDFDLVIMDRLMPKLGGDQAVQVISTEAPNLPVVVLSGFIDPPTRERLLAGGVAACLQKPVGIAELVNTLDAVLKRAKSGDQVSP